MALQSSGTIRFSEIEDEFGGSGDVRLSEYYGADSAGAGDIPASGTIRLSDFYGTSAYVPITAPYITTNPSSGSGSSGSKTLYCYANDNKGGSTITYQWQYKNSGSSTWNTSTTGSSKTVSYTSTNNGRSYRCIASNEAGSVTSSTATITVILTAPYITSNPSSVSGTSGSKTMTCNASDNLGGSTIDYTWQYRRAGVSTWSTSTLNGKTISVSISSTNDGTQYRCKPVNAAGYTYSSAATITQNLSAPSITSNPPSVLSGRQGNSVTLSCNATDNKGGSGLNYVWVYKKPTSSSYVEGGYSVYGKTATLALWSDRKDFRYKCKVTNSAGTAYTTSVLIDIELV